MKYKVDDKVKIKCTGECNIADSRHYTGEGSIEEVNISSKLQYCVNYETGLWHHKEECLSLVEKDRKYKVGEKVEVKCVPSCGTVEEYTTGTGEIAEVKDDDKYKYNVDQEGTEVLHMEECLSSVVQASEDTELKVGDKVKILSEGRFNGLKGVIKQDDKTDAPYEVELDYGGRSRKGWFTKESIELATSTLEDLFEGDELKSDRGTDITVILVLKPGLYAVQDNSNERPYLITAKRLKEYKYTIVKQEEEEEMVIVSVNGEEGGKEMTKESAIEQGFLDE